MGNNTITRKKRKRIWPIEIIAGLFIMMIVFFIAELSEDLGEAMVGINPGEIQIIMEERGR